MSFRTPQFEHFVAPALPTAAFWRLIVGMIMISVVYFVVVLGAGFAALASDTTGDPALAVENLITGNTRLTLSLILLSFLGAVIGIVVATIAIHRRSPLTLVGPIRPMVKHFMIAVGVFFALQFCVYGVWGYFYDGIPQRSFWSMLSFLPVAAVLVLIQTGAEELLFRGYLMQQLGARFKSPIVWFVIPPVAFGLLHYNPEMMGDLTWFAIIAITLVGLLWTDLTRVTGNIGAAWGWHFANNFMLMNFLGNSGELNGFVWMTTPYEVKDLPPTLFMIDMALAIVTWLILRRLCVTDCNSPEADIFR